jgi:nitric oxide dioxygenase
MTTLSESTKATVKETIPLLEARGIEIVSDFYAKLFSKYPVTAGFFNKDRVDTETGVPPQVASLAGAVVAYAKHIDDVSSILPGVERICHKHVSR